jgi:hypothetical protein
MTTDERIARLERVVNQLDREAEALEAHVEILTERCRGYHYAISALMRELWPNSIQSKKWSHARHIYDGLWPEKDPEYGFGRMPSWWWRWKRPDRRVPMYGSRADLLAKAAEHGIKVRKRQPRQYLVRDLEHHGLAVRREIIEAPA